MEEPAPNYFREFLKSPHHAAFALATLGLGFVSGMLLPLIIGGTLYGLGWIYLPDSGLFRTWLDRRNEAARRLEEMKQITEFVQRRDALIASLSASRRERYGRLAKVCRDIESAGADNSLASATNTNDPRLRKLEELMWTYLRLLGIEESLECFLEIERREDLPTLVRESETEIGRLGSELEGLKAKGPGPTLETKQRYFGSRLECLEVLRKRLERIELAQSNLALVLSEQERLDQQIKFIRADAVASKNAEALTARIDATVEHLDQTNKWLSELDEFKDLVGDLPPTSTRLGYESSQPPPLPHAEPPVRPTLRHGGADQ